jgi:hypothetical protein
LAKKTAGQQFKEAFQRDFTVETPADAVVLDRCCALLDQVEAMEDELERRGFDRVLLASIRGHSAELARMVKRLGMEPPETDPRKLAGKRAAEARWRKS